MEDFAQKYFLEIATGIVAWLAKLELAHRSNLRKITSKSEQEIREVKLKLEDHDSKLIYMQTEAKTNSIQLTQILIEIQALKTGLEYIKEEMVRK